MIQLSTVINIDDNEDDVFLAQFFLKKYIDANYLAFNYANDALEYLGEERDYNKILIFLDLNLPRMSGVQFLEKLQFFNNTFPVVILNTLTHPKQRKKLERYTNILGLFEKPLTEPKTMEIIKLLQSDLNFSNTD